MAEEIVTITSKRAAKHYKRSQREPEALSGIYTYWSPKEEIQIEITSDDLHDFEQGIGVKLTADILDAKQCGALIDHLMFEKQVGQISTPYHNS